MGTSIKLSAGVFPLSKDSFEGRSAILDVAICESPVSFSMIGVLTTSDSMISFF